MFYTYVLWSLSRPRTYTGSTHDWRRRLDEHNRGKVRSTRAYAPFVVLVLEEHVDVSQAVTRERYFKSTSGRRELKEIVAKFILRESCGESASPTK